MREQVFSSTLQAAMRAARARWQGAALTVVDQSDSRVRQKENLISPTAEFRAGSAKGVQIVQMNTLDFTCYRVGVYDGARRAQERL